MFFVAGPATGAATTGAATVTWQAPDACPQADAVQRELAARLEGAPATVRLQGRVEVVDGHFELDLQTTIEGPRGHVERRTLRGDTCEELVAAAALIAAAAAEPRDAVESPPSEPLLAEPPVADPPVPTADAVPTAAPPPAPTPAPAPTPRRAPPRRRGWRVGASIGVDVGATPDPTGAFEAFASWGGRWVRGELGGRYFAPTRSQAVAGAVLVQMGAMAPRLCATPAARRVTFGICVGAELGAMRGDGRGVEGSRTAHALWVAPLGSADATWWLRPAVGLRVRAEVAIPVQRPRFELREPGPAQTLFIPAAVAGRGLLGVVFRFPRPA